MFVIALIIAVILWALGVAAWFGVYTLLVYLLSLAGIIEFNLLYPAILTVATVIINALIRTFRGGNNDD